MRQPLLTILIALAAPSLASAQQTIFNVPTADVLENGKLYLETDWLWRPGDPAFASGSPIRGVYGLGGCVEAGVNFSGIVTPGRSDPVAVPNVLSSQMVTLAGIGLTTMQLTTILIAIAIMLRPSTCLRV